MIRMQAPKLYAFADEASKEMDGQIRAMLRNGLNGLEIRGVDGENVSKITTEKAKEVRRKLDDNGLITWSIGSPIGKIKLTALSTSGVSSFRSVYLFATSMNFSTFVDAAFSSSISA